MTPSSSSSVCCERCNTAVCLAEARIRVAGKHSHQVMNPAGYLFDVVCYERASGCIGAGEASNQATWFPGYTWQRAFCKACSNHLGWLFRSKSHMFFGLIAERLRGNADPVADAAREHQ